MQRKTRVLLRAAKYLEREARDYVDAGREQPADAKWCGQRATMLFAIAYSVREISSSGYAPQSDADKMAGFSALRWYQKMLSKKMLDKVARRTKTADAFQSATAYSTTRTTKEPL